MKTVPAALTILALALGFSSGAARGAEAQGPAAPAPPSLYKRLGGGASSAPREAVRARSGALDIISDPMLACAASCDSRGWFHRAAAPGIAPAPRFSAPGGWHEDV